LPEWFSAAWQAIPTEAALAAPFITLLAYTVFGLTGFGAGLISAPLLAHLLPLRFIVPMQLMLDLVASFTLVGRERSRINRAELIWIVPFMLLGMLGGVALLIGLSQRVLMLSLGGFVLCYGLLGVLGRAPKRRLARPWVAPLSFVGGVGSALFGTGGPIYAIYLASRIEDKRELRATITAVVWVSGITRIVVFGASGLLFQDGLWLAFLLLVPFGLGGLALGNRLHHRLSAERVRHAIYFLLLASGGSLILRGV